MNERALVILSGGQDSTTCLFWAKKHFHEVCAVGFDYGQRHKEELMCAESICKRNNVHYEIIETPTINFLTSNSLTRLDIPISAKKKEDETYSSLVEGRNLLFLSYAAIYAKVRNINNLVIGVSETDYSGYFDCRDIFIKSLNVTLNLSMDFGFVIHTPLMWLSKAEVWNLADDLGVLNLVREETLTCYNGIVSQGCGYCPACILRQNGYNEFLKMSGRNQGVETV